MKALSLLVVALSAVVSRGAESTDQFSIDDYSFTWKVAESGNARLEVEKTNENTTVRLLSEHDGLRITPADAEKLADVLRSTDTYWSKLKGPKDAQETAKAGGLEVTFRNSGKYGFGVSVRERGGFAFSSVSLDRKQAHALMPYLKKSTAMAKHADRVIETGLAAQK